MSSPRFDEAAADDAPLHADAIHARLPADRLLGREIVVLDETGSTNDEIARAANAAAPEGLVVFAERQRAGRGRQGRRWESRAGVGLWFSLLLRPPGQMSGWAGLSLWAALGVAEAAETATGVGAEIKWPNDVLVAGRKVAGILIETHAGKAQDGAFAVVGIGINVGHRPDDFSSELRDRAGSLAQFSQRPVNRLALASTVLMRLDANYRLWQSAPTEIVAACSRRCSLRGRRVRSLLPGGPEGVATGFDAAGQLLLRDDAGQLHTLASGELQTL